MIKIPNRVDHTAFDGTTIIRIPVISSTEMAKDRKGKNQVLGPKSCAPFCTDILLHLQYGYDHVLLQFRIAHKQATILR